MRVRRERHEFRDKSWRDVLGAHLLGENPHVFRVRREDKLFSLLQDGLPTLRIDRFDAAFGCEFPEKMQPRSYVAYRSGGGRGSGPHGAPRAEKSRLVSWELSGRAEVLGGLRHFGFGLHALAEIVERLRVFRESLDLVACTLLRLEFLGECLRALVRHVLT